MNESWHYLAVLALCVLITLPLEFFLGARVWRRPRRLFMTLLAVVAVFVPVDLLGITRGWWTYSPTYTVGWSIGSLPIEELLFFLVVPLCGVLTYEAVGECLRRFGRSRG